MTQSLPLDSIIIDRPARQRRKLASIESLADSISRTGLIHPPVVTRDRVLVAGERRITAMRSLGWTATPVTYTDQLDPAALALIELEENIARESIHWKDEVLAVVEYNRLRASEDGWSRTALSKALGRSLTSIIDTFVIAGELDRNNMLVADADKYSVALGLAKRAQERRREDEQVAMGQALVNLDDAETDTQYDGYPEASPLPEPMWRDDLDPPSKRPAGSRPTPPILCGDFSEWATAYQGRPFNFIHCDFPYGVNADKRQQGSGHLVQGTYADSPEVYWQLLTCLAANQHRIAAPSAHMLFWFSMDFYTETIGFFAREMPDWDFQPFPLYWSKSDNVGLLPDHQRGPRRVVETALLGSRGDRKIVRAVANHVAAPTDRVHHISTKPIPVLTHFFRMLIDEGSTFLDPTCGGGTSLVAAREAGASRILGIERDPEFHRRACARWEGLPSGGESAADGD